MQNVILAIIGVMFLAMGSYQVSPSVMKYIQTKKADNLVEKEKAIFDAVQRYISATGTVPTSLSALVDNGYVSASTVNDNGWGNPISIDINETNTTATGLVKLKTEIPNQIGKDAFLISWKNWIKPTNSSGDIVVTSFIIPTDILHGNAGGVLSGAIVSATQPSSTTSKYWYDTSGANAVLKMFDGTNWKPISVATSGSGGGLPPLTSANTVSSTFELPSSGTIGDIRYVYNTATNTVDTYTYYSTGWRLFFGNATDGLLSSIISFSPSIIYIDLNTTFNITGTKLSSGLVLNIQDAICGDINIASPTSATVKCKSTIAGNNKPATITKNGNSVFNGTVSVMPLPFLYTNVAVPDYLGLLSTNQKTSVFGGDDGFYKRGKPRSFVNSNGVVVDTITGLMWEDQPANMNATYTRATAITYCNNLVYGGFSDWELPKNAQLLSIINYDLGDPKYYYPEFQYIDLLGGGLYASSTTIAYSINTFETWADFLQGQTIYGNINVHSDFHVKCVRNVH